MVGILGTRRMSTCTCTSWTRFSRLVDIHERGSSWGCKDSGFLLTDESHPSMDNEPGQASDLSPLWRASEAFPTATEAEVEN